jgi:hypothetical protein
MLFSVPADTVQPMGWVSLINLANFENTSIFRLADRGSICFETIERGLMYLTQILIQFFGIQEIAFFGYDITEVKQRP